MEKRVVEYTIIVHEFASDVAEEVNRHLDEGWELYGELKVSAYFAAFSDGEGRNEGFYSQAMVRRESEEEE
jgi:hypothetical protein